MSKKKMSRIDPTSPERLRRISINFMGGNQGIKWKCNGKMPHPNMEPRNEFNIHVFGYRFAITWEIW